MLFFRTILTSSLKTCIGGLMGSCSVWSASAVVAASRLSAWGIILFV